MAKPKLKPKAKPKPAVKPELTAKLSRFVDEYVVDFNGTQAAIRAGYSKKTARIIASQNLTKPAVAKAIQERMTKLAAKTEITAERVLAEYAKIGFSDIRKAVKWGSELVYRQGDDAEAEPGEAMIQNGVALLNSEDLDDSTAAAISEISKGRDGIKIKFHDKKGALDSISRHLGMFKDKVEHSGPNGGPISFQQMLKEINGAGTGPGPG